jgi:hypothetical protein
MKILAPIGTWNSDLLVVQSVASRFKGFINREIFLLLRFLGSAHSFFWPRQLSDEVKLSEEDFDVAK